MTNGLNAWGSTPQRLMVAALLGVCLGAANSLSNALGSPYSPVGLSSEGVLPLQVLAALLGTTWAWSIMGFLAGRLAHRIWVGPLAGVVCLLVADLAYYWVDKVSGYAGGIDQGGMLYWGMLAIPCGLGMGLLGALSVQPRWWSLAPGLTAPLTIVVLAAPSGPPDIQPWSAMMTNVVVIAVGLLVVASWAYRVVCVPRMMPHRSDPTTSAVGALTNRSGRA